MAMARSNPNAPRRAPRGSAKDTIGIYIDLDPELHALFERAVADRGITKRRLVEAAIRRELADPSVWADTEPQEELPLKTA